MGYAVLSDMFRWSEKNKLSGPKRGRGPQAMRGASDKACYIRPRYGGA